MKTYSFTREFYSSIPGLESDKYTSPEGRDFFSYRDVLVYVIEAEFGEICGGDEELLEGYLNGKGVFITIIDL